MPPRLLPLLGLLLLGAGCKTASASGQAPQPSSPEEDAARALMVVQSRATDAEREGCPADAFAPAARETGDAFLTYCDGRRTWCAEQCFGADATACYGLALALQQAEHPQAAETLFARACTLGVTSGCTNRAAGMLAREPERAAANACAARTFAQACEREDAWGCTMHAGDLLERPDARQHADRIRKALDGGCRYGVEDPACQAAGQLRKALERLETERL
jgi:hypothetical protein